MSSPNSIGPGTTVAVTGASAGLGRAIAEAFAKRGANVGLIARGEKRLRAAQESVEKLGGKAIWCSADVADAEALEGAADRIESELGPIDIWVNDAMTSVFARFSETKAEEFDRVTAVTYLGCVHGTMAALHRMIPRNRGRIIQVGSVLAYRSIPLQASYCGAKHAIRGFTDSVRCELIHDKIDIKITMVQMPGMNTPQFDWVLSRLPKRAQPVPPIFQPEVGAEAVVYCCTRNKREMYVGFPVLQGMWGNKFIAGFLDRYMAKKAWDGQMVDQPADPGRPCNLWEPVDADFGAHGRFDQRARATPDWQIKLDRFLTNIGILNH